MAMEKIKQRLQEETTCSICLDHFVQPVMLSCGHNFCMGCITRCWKEEAKNIICGHYLEDPTCPNCRVRTMGGLMIPNRQLGCMVQITRDLHDFFSLCQTHPEPLQFFLDRRERLWALCQGTRRHPPHGHRVVPANEEAEEFKDKLICRSTLLDKAEDEKKSQELLKQMEAETRKTKSAFRKMHQFLEEQEKVLLFQMEKVKKDMVGKKDTDLARIFGEVYSREVFMEENQQPIKNELQKNFPNVMARVKQAKFQNPKAVFSALEWSIHDFGDINLFLESTMKHFKETLVTGFQLQKVNVTLDPDTAHPQLIMTEDLISMIWNDNVQDLPNNPERFDTLPVVLGCEGCFEGFAKGRCFWEVAVTGEKEWMIGVAIKSVKRKNKFDISTKEGIWALGRLEGKYWATSDSSDISLPLSRQIGKLRMVLNCAGGQIAFFDGDSGAHLYKYSFPFSDNTLIPFFYLTGKVSMTIFS